MAAVRREGAALIIVLWTVGLLSMLVASLAFDAHIEARIAGYYRRRSQADYLARSTLDVARLVMARSVGVSPRGDLSAGDAADRWYEPARQLADGRSVRVSETLGDAVLTVELTPEPARRNVNRLNEPRHIEDWERILEVGGIPHEFWPELIDSFYDWVDPDDEARLDGAESEYYLSLDPPYRARNGPVDTVGELLLVKGFSQAILWGGPLDPGLGDGDEGIVVSGIADMLTTYGDGKVNINAASRRVLMTLPGIDMLVADLIVEERRAFQDDSGQEQDVSFESPEDFMLRVGAIADLDAGIQELITTRSRIYRVSGSVSLHGVTRRVWGIVEGDGAEIRILRWREHE